MKWWQRFQLVGNKWKVAVGIFLFILFLIVVTSRCAQAAEVDLRTGVSVTGGASAVLGIDYHIPVSPTLDFVAGTNLWSKNSLDDNNWDWHAGFRTCQWNFCAQLGATYVQRIDSLNGTHTNYNLQISYLIPWGRVSSVGLFHISNAGTTPNNGTNRGRNMVFVDWRLQ
jgi:hypothetical protein